MAESELTCGQELAESAEVPQRLAALANHVAQNLEAHARWVGTESADAQREHDAMLAVAREYQNLSAAAERAASIMTACKDLPATAHDPTRFERSEFLAWMQRKIVLQRELAELLLEHAAQSERAMAHLQSASEPTND